MLLNAVGVYIFIVTLGGVAFWQCGILYDFVHYDYLTCRWVTPDPVDWPMFIAFMLSPLPGLAAAMTFMLAVRRRVRNPSYAERKRVVAR